MVDVMEHKLIGRALRINNQLRFTRAEWWEEAPQFVLLRFEVHGREAPAGVRLDIEKKVILDSVAHEAISRDLAAELDAAIKSQAKFIWECVVRECYMVEHNR